MSDIIMRYEDYLIHTKHASDNTVASYMRDLRQYASYLGSEGIDVLDADQDVVSGECGPARSLSAVLGQGVPQRGQAAIGRMVGLAVVNGQDDEFLGGWGYGDAEGAGTDDMRGIQL